MINQKWRESATNLLYHVSPSTNRASILKSGVEPLFSRVKTQACWYVSRDRVLWALAHCSARHGVPVCDLDVWTVHTMDMKRLRRTKHTGVFNSPCRTKALSYASAAAYLEDEK